MGHVQTERNTFVHHLFQAIHHDLSVTGFVLAPPVIKPSAPELAAHQRSVGTYFFQFGKLLVDISSRTKIYSPKQIIQTIIQEIRTPVTLEQRHFSKACGAYRITDGRHIGLVRAIRTIFVFHLHHDDVTTTGNLQILQLLAHFMHKGSHVLHIERIESAKLHAVVLQQPPRQTAHFPFRTYIRTGTHNDVHAMLLSQFTESRNILVACKVIIAGSFLMQIPKDI